MNENPEDPTLTRSLESAVCILSVGYMFFTDILDWTVFGIKTLDTIEILYSFCFCITPVTTVSASFGGYSID